MADAELQTFTSIMDALVRISVSICNAFICLLFACHRCGGAYLCICHQFERIAVNRDSEPQYQAIVRVIPHVISCHGLLFLSVIFLRGARERGAAVLLMRFKT